MSFKNFIRSKRFLVHLVLLIVFIIALVYASLLFLKLYTYHGQALSVPNLTGFSELEVKTIVEKEKLRYKISDSVYVYDAIPGIVISQHPYPGYKVKKNRTIYLTISAVSPEKVKLPVIVDVSLREAKSRLENAGFQLGRVEYRPSEFINLVLEQRMNGLPLPKDTMLNKGTPVDLVVGLGLSNERTEVPNLLGMYIDEARDTLYNLTLTLGVHVYDSSVKTAADSMAAVIWKQDPRALGYNLVELGTSIDIWLTADFQKIDELLSIDPEFDLENEFGFDE